MDSIESRCNLRTDYRTARLSRALGVSRVQVIGHLHLLWWSAAIYLRDDSVAKWDAGQLAFAAEWEGDEDVFCEALKSSGFVVDDRLADWDRIVGKTLARRAAGRERAKARDAELRAAVIERDGLVCGICAGDVAMEDVALDHIIPLSKGGPTTFENLRVTHAVCNSRRGARD